MYKVVIIDDEPMIVEGLTKGLEWEKWNCKVVGNANNGMEGIELIRVENPDIVITDISMPKVDGLGMIAALKSEFPDMQITILTGFREFDYAQRAIALGVTRFLLKPSKFAELEEAIDVMTAKLKERHKEEKEEKDEAVEENSANSFIVNNALEYMRAHYTEKLRLIDVAEEVFVSQWHLSKLLNKTTGQNFSEDAFKYSHNAFVLDTETLKIEVYENPYALKFYKIEHAADLDKVKYPAVCTIKCEQSQSNEVKKLISNSVNLVESRLIIAQDTGKTYTEEDKKELIDVDHLKQFSEYILETLGNTEIVNNELMEVLK